MHHPACHARHPRSAHSAQPGDLPREQPRNGPRHALASALLAVTAASFGLALPLSSQAQEGPPPADGPDQPGPPRDHHAGHHGGPFVHALRELDLSDAQRQTLRGYLRSARDEAEDARASLQPLRRSFELAAPDSSGYQATATQLANAEARLAAERVQHEAALKAKVYALLSDAQKAQLNRALAATPKPRAPL